MAKIVSPNLRFRPSTAADVVEHRLRENADYDEPFVRVTKAADADGYVRIPASTIPFLSGIEDDVVSVFVTAADEVGNESDFLTVTGPLDLVAPDAPTEGGLSAE